MNRNPAYRYAAIPVELPRGQLRNVVYIVRMRTKEQAIKRVANTVDPESLIDVGGTRTFDTKKQAKESAGDKHTVYLDATKPTTVEAPKTVEEVMAEKQKAANPKLELEEIYDDGSRAYLYVTDPSWVFGLDDEVERQFGVFFEVLDMYDATGEDEFEDYPWIVEASLVAHEPSPEFSREAGLDEEEITRETAMWDAYSYGGGVPISHILMTEISTEGKEGLVPLLKGIAKKDYEIVEDQPTFGTVAAQRGPGTRIEVPRFRTQEAATQFVQNIVDSGRLGALGMMIGFILDRPINLMGEPGWTTMEMWVRGPRKYNNPSTKKLKNKLLR